MQMDRLALAATAALVTLAADQFTKTAAVGHLVDKPTRATSPSRPELVRSGRAGIGRLAVPRTASLAVCLVTTAIALSLIAFTDEVPTVAALGLGAAIGGGAGNCADLLIRGEIVDFIRIGRWPVFNLADVALTVGVGMTVVGTL